MMTRDRYALALLLATAASIASGRALGRPLLDPTPAPSATPISTSTPATGATIAPPTPSPAPSASPAPAGSPAPAATVPPAQETVPLPPPSPTTTSEPATATTGEAMPTDYTAGMPGSPRGSRRMRAGLAIGVHVFAGEGWDRKVGPPPNDDPPRGADYVGGSLAGFGLYDLTPILAAVATVGGHNGTHGKDLGVGTTRITTSYNTWYADGALRLQTPANILGVWLQGGGGVYAARKVVQTKTTISSNVNSEGRAGFTAHVSAGAQYHLAQGLDIFGETRWMFAPGYFTDDPRLDLGGFTVQAGATLRL